MFGIVRSLHLAVSILTPVGYAMSRNQRELSRFIICESMIARANCKKINSITALLSINKVESNSGYIISGLTRTLKNKYVQ